MNMKIQTAIKGTAIALAFLVATGCASTSTMDELNARVDSLAADVARAQSAADAAGATASEARQMSSGAQSTANQALNAANQSQACCDATNEKIDRMFEKGMAK
jgi:murein lipoprotein